MPTCGNRNRDGIGPTALSRRCPRLLQLSLRPRPLAPCRPQLLVRHFRPRSLRPSPQDHHLPSSPRHCRPPLRLPALNPPFHQMGCRPRLPYQLWRMTRFRFQPGPRRHPPCWHPFRRFRHRQPAHRSDFSPRMPTSVRSKAGVLARRGAETARPVHYQTHHLILFASDSWRWMRPWDFSRSAKVSAFLI